MPEDLHNQARAYYNEEAAVYDQNRYGNTGGRRLDLFQKRLIDDHLAASLPAGASLLEVGCGTGRFVAHLARQGFRIWGLDLSPGMLSVAKARSEHAGHVAGLCLGMADRLPFADASFDAAFSILVLNLVPDIGAVFSEISRVLRPGALFLFSVPNLGSIYAPAGLYVNLRGKTTTANAAGFRPSRWFTRPDLESRLGAARLSLVDCWGQPPHVRLMESCSALPGRGVGGVLSKSLYLLARREPGPR